MRTIKEIKSELKELEELELQLEKANISTAALQYNKI